MLSSVSYSKEAYDRLMDVGFLEITHMGSLNPPKLSVVYWHGNHQLSQPLLLLALIHALTTSVSF